MPTAAITCPECHAKLQLTIEPAPATKAYPQAFPQPTVTVAEPQVPVAPPQVPVTQPPVPVAKPTVAAAPSPAPAWQAPPPRGIEPRPPVPKPAAASVSVPTPASVSVSKPAASVSDPTPVAASVSVPKPPPATSRLSSIPPMPPVVLKPMHKTHRLSPQGTLLSLGVLLVLAAGVTFLAVNWHTLPAALQAGIIATLAALAFVGSVPASRRSLVGTAEAMAILGSGLLTVDLYGARELGLVSPKAISGVTYSAIVFGSLCLITLAMTRVVPKVVTFGVTAVIAGQLPLPLVLWDRVSLPIALFAFLVQAVATLTLSAKGTPIVRRTGAITSTVVFCGILVAGMVQTFLGLVDVSLNNIGSGEVRDSVLTAAVVCLTSATGIVILGRRPLPPAIAWGVGEGVCAAAAGFVIAMTLPQLPGPGRWLTTAVATALVIAELVLALRINWIALILHVLTITVAAFNISICMLQQDWRQLGYIAAIIAVLAIFAAVRKVVPAVMAVSIASLSAQSAILLFLADEYISGWAGVASLAIVGAVGIGIACRYVGKPLERPLMATAGSAVLLGLLMAGVVDPDAGVGVVLVLAAAPLVAYGMNPARRAALPAAGALLILANTAFVLSAGATTPEWFTVPAAIVLLAVGILAWRNQSSWVYLGPGLLVGLVPSAVLADSNDNWVRVTCVVAAAVVVIVIGAQRGLQAPFVIGALVLAKIGIWQFLDVAPLIPRWITLGIAGGILLAVGATYERRLTQAKQAARWLSALK